MADTNRMIAEMRALLAEPTPYELFEAFVKGLPESWRALPPAQAFERLRCLVEITQEQIARRSGLHQSAVSLLEGGRDSRLSTWRRAYDAMGFELVLLPVPRGSVDELRKRSATDRLTTRWWRLHARPRRRWKEHYALRRAERAQRKAAARAAAAQREAWLAKLRKQEAPGA